MDTGLMLRRMHRQQPGQEEDLEPPEGHDPEHQDLQLVGQELVPVEGVTETVEVRLEYETPPRPHAFLARRLALRPLRLPRTARRALCPGGGSPRDPLLTGDTSKELASVDAETLVRGWERK